MSRFITAETSMGIETACDDETMLTAALIDVGGTLWPDRPPPSAKDLYVARLQEDFNLTTEEADRLLGELDRRNPARLWPPSLTQDGVAMATKALDAARLERINAAALLTTMDIPAFGVIDLFPGVKTLLQDIRQLGLRSVIFSNATFRTAAAYPSRLPGILDRRPCR